MPQKYVDRREFFKLLGGATAGFAIADPRDSSSRSQPSHHSSIHDAINNLPDEGGIVYLTAGQHYTNKPVILGDGITLIGAGQNATVLKPTADIDVVSIQGTNAGLADLKIQDTDQAQSESHGLTLNGAHQSVVSDIVIAETANGLLADNNVDDDRDVWENSLRSIHIRDTKGYGFKFQGAYHDNSHVDLFANRCGGDGFIWKTGGVDGGNKYTQCIGISCETGFRIISAQELWFNQIIADSNRSTGFFISGGFEGRLFGGQFWTSTNGNNGLELSTRDGGSIKDIYIDQHYSWQNQNFGILTDGFSKISRVIIGTLSTHHNQVGARFAARKHNEIWLNWIHSRENSTVGVDGNGGCGVNVGHANILDGWDQESSAVKRWQNIGISTVKKGNSPHASKWSRGDLIEKVSDSTLWLKSVATGGMIKI